MAPGYQDYQRDAENVDSFDRLAQQSWHPKKQNQAL
jgi:hypothetical protein